MKRLPLGSVVHLDMRKSPVMIIGYDPGIIGADVHPHYLGVNYPFGLSQTLCAVAFNDNEISNVLHIGHSEDTSQDTGVS